MKYLFIALFVGIICPSWAQNSLSGTVSDSINKPLRGVSVFLPDLHKTAITNNAGQYLFNNLPSGNIRMTFTSVGYATEQRNAIVSGATVFDLQLKQTEFEMDEVVVSTAFSRLQSQNVMKVERQSVVEMQKKGAATLIEGLTTVPGVSQVSTGTSIGKPVIRGLSANRVLVYSQGVRLENQQFGDEHGLGLSDSGIESAEIIKGPASLLYGSDAIGGVLYLNPEKFAEAGAFKGDFTQRLFSNTLGSSTNLGLKTSTENWKFLVRGNYATHSDYKIPDGDRVTNTRFNEQDFKAAAGYSKGNFSTVFRYNYNHLDLGIPEEGIAEQTDTKSTAYPKQEVASHIASLNNTLFFGNSKLDANFGFISNGRSEFEDSPQATLKMRLNTFNYDLKFHFPKWDNWEAIAGVQGLSQENSNDGSERLIPDARVNDFGTFVTTNVEWGRNTFQTGLRYDTRKIMSEAFGLLGEEGSFSDLDRSFSSFNAQAGYRRSLTDKMSLRLNLASGFRAPNLAELTSNGVHEGTNRYEIGNAALVREQNFQTDLNLEFNDTHFEFFVNGFYNHINDYIYAAPTGETIDAHVAYAYIQGNANLYGGEAGFHFHPHPLDWLHIESSFSTVTGERSDGEYLPLIPANTWSNTIRTEFDSKTWLQKGFATVNVTHTFDQDNASGFETETDGYTLVNLGFGGNIRLDKTAFRINLNANNLLDETYIAHLSRLKPDGIPNIGRNIILGVGFDL